MRQKIVRYVRQWKPAVLRLVGVLALSLSLVACASDCSRTQGMAEAVVILLVLAGIGAFAWLFSVGCRCAAKRLEARRVREAEELLNAAAPQPVFPRWKRIAIALGCFASGAFLQVALSGSVENDPIFRQHVPWYGLYNVLLSGMTFSTLGLALCGVTFAKTVRRGVLLALAVWELSFVIHLADAFSFWGHGMTFAACVRGFAERCFSHASGAAAFAFAFSPMILLTLCRKSSRRDLTLCGLTCGRYLGNVLRLVAWFALLGLLVHETLILIWLNLAF